MVNYYYYSFNMSSLFKFFNKLFLIFSLMYTGYYTLKFQWIRNYMNFGICPELPAMLAICQIMNILNIFCSCCFCNRILGFIIYMVAYYFYFKEVCYDEYDKTVPELIECFEVQILMQVFYLVLCII